MTTPLNPSRSSRRPISWRKRFWVGTWPPQRMIQWASRTSAGACVAFRRSSITTCAVSMPEAWIQSRIPLSTESVKPWSSGAALTSSTFGGRPGATRARAALTSARKPLSSVKAGSPNRVGLPVRNRFISEDKDTNICEDFFIFVDTETFYAYGARNRTHRAGRGTGGGCAF